MRGRQWLVRGIANPVSVACRDLMKAVGIHREGVGFYTLRHIFETVAGGSRDQVAVNAIMGHADSSMAATYREHIDDERLQAVVDHVRTWLFSNGKSSKDNHPTGVSKNPAAQNKHTRSAKLQDRIRDDGGPLLRIVG